MSLIGQFWLLLNLLQVAMQFVAKFPLIRQDSTIHGSTAVFCFCYFLDFGTIFTVQSQFHCMRWVVSEYPFLYKVSVGLSESTEVKCSIFKGNYGKT